MKVIKCKLRFSVSSDASTANQIDYVILHIINISDLCCVTLGDYHREIVLQLDWGA